MREEGEVHEMTSLLKGAAGQGPMHMGSLGNSNKNTGTNDNLRECWSNQKWMGDWEMGQTSTRREVL